MANYIKSSTSFWAEISDCKIQVPYYQRDYAQGRKDGEYNKDNYVKGRIDNIREVFVEELYEAINNNGKCHLGLVFGSYDEDDKIFIAVDGQQRLTTVFLLHWYVAWRENKLNDYKVLSTNFSWDTRSYSSQFVKLLFKIERSDDVIYAITTNPDYFSVWENDPTVKGMLIMLKEIEEQYPKSESDLCFKLFSSNCNIRYDILKLKKDSDGKTYLKMNSRGRSLTTFELFKSKFIDYFKPGYAEKFDNNWLKFMLEMSKTEDCFKDPDICYMNFINEYTYFQLRKGLGKGKEKKEDHKLFINAKLKGNLLDIPFISFGNYKPAFENKLEEFNNFLDWIVDNYNSIREIDCDIRFSNDKFFLDSIIKDNNPYYSDRAKFFAAFVYADLTEFAPVDKLLYLKWARVFRNLIENTDIDDENFGNICKAIYGIDNPDIYSYLLDNNIGTFDGDQVKEEITKAKQILDENGNIRKYNGSCKKENGSNYETWEDIIIEAEKTAFFKGSIRFLFQNENGKADIIISTGIWNTEKFDTKFSNSKKYFDENGIKDIYKVDVVKSLVFQCDDWENQLYDKQLFNPQNSTWKWILTDKNWTVPIHNILTKDLDKINCSTTLNNTDADNYILPILKKLPYKELIIEEPKGRFKRNGQLGYYKPNGRDAITFDWGNFRRNELLNQLTESISISNKKIGSFWWGWDISFIYKNLYFKFYWNNTICLMNDNWNGKKLREESGQDKPENNFWFHVSEQETSLSLLEKLDKLIHTSINDSNVSTSTDTTE